MCCYCIVWKSFLNAFHNLNICSAISAIKIEYIVKYINIYFCIENVTDDEFYHLSMEKLCKIFKEDVNLFAFFLPIYNQEKGLLAQESILNAVVIVDEQMPLGYTFGSEDNACMRVVTENVSFEMEIDQEEQENTLNETSNDRSEISSHNLEGLFY